MKGGSWLSKIIGKMLHFLRTFYPEFSEPSQRVCTQPVPVGQRWPEVRAMLHQASARGPEEPSALGFAHAPLPNESKENNRCGFISESPPPGTYP